MKIQESGENYLETILVLSQTLPRVRPTDVSVAMGYSKPSVTRAMTVLKNAGHLMVSDQGGLELTASGRALAERVYERHRVLTGCLKMLGVDDETAAADACRIEHVISEQTFEKIKAHTKKEG